MSKKIINYFYSLSPYILLILLFFGLNQIFQIDPFYNADSTSYHNIAVNLVKGHGYSCDGLSPSINRPPTLVVALAILYRIFGINASLVIIINLISLLLSLFLLKKIAKKLFSIDIEKLLTFLFLIYIPNYLYAYQIRVESSLLFLLLLAIYLLLTKKNFFSVPVIVLLILNKGIFIVFPLLWLIPLIFGRVKDFFKQLILIYLGIFILLTPWMYRNYVHFGKPIYSSVGLADVLYPGNNLKYDGDYQGYADPYFKYVYENYNDVEAEEILIKTAIDSMKKYPLATLLLWLKKSVRYWFPPIGFESLFPKNALIAYSWFLFYLGLLISACHGIFLEIKSSWSILAFILCYYAIHIVLYAIARYHYPLLPLLMIYSARSCTEIFSKFKNGNYWLS